MDTLQSQLSATLEELPNAILTALVERKLSEQGIILTEEERADLSRQLRSDSGLTTAQIGSGQSRGRVKIEFTDEDAATLEKKLEDLLASLPSKIQSLSNELAVDIGQSLDRKWPSQERLQKSDTRRFREGLSDRWRQPLSKLHQQITIATEFGASVNNRLRAQPSTSTPYVREVQTRLHARACQIAQEVLCLLEAGFGDGAMARWRSLHEVAVVAMFIGNDEALAERYRLHEIVESLRVARLYAQHTERLKLEPLEPETIPAMELDVAALKQRFKDSFGSSYGWAAERLNNPNPKLQHIEEAVVPHLRPYYQLASHNVHANPKGAFFRLGLTDQSEVLLAGPSTFGLADAGQHTALSLSQITSTLGMVDPNLDSVVTMKIVVDLGDEIGNLFVRVHQELEDGVVSQEDVTQNEVVSDIPIRVRIMMWAASVVAGVRGGSWRS